MSSYRSSHFKFRQIMLQVLKYAPTQLLHATFTKIKAFHGVRKDDENRYYAYANTYSTKLFDKKLHIWVTKKHYEVYDTFIMIKRYPNREPHIMLSCSCPDFKYRHEVALWRRGAAEIEYSNGRLPKITNPRYRPTCCKHCLRMYDFLSKKFPLIYPPDQDLLHSIG